MDYNKLIHEANANAALRAKGVSERIAAHLVRKYGHERIFELLRRDEELILFLAQEIEELEERLQPHSGTTVFKNQKGDEQGMNISVHVNDVPMIAQAQEWTGANGTGTLVPPSGAITFKSDNPAAVTVDPNTGALTYVAPGVANISFADAGLPSLSVQAGQVTVTAAAAVSGTVVFVPPTTPAPTPVPAPAKA